MIGVVIAVVLTLVFVGLPILAAFKARQGRNWARILGTVIAAIAGSSPCSVWRAVASPPS